MKAIVITIVVSFVTSVVVSFLTFFIFKRIWLKNNKMYDEAKKENDVERAASRNSDVSLTKKGKEELQTVVTINVQASETTKEVNPFPKERKLSKKELQKLQRKEERAQKREEKARREEELAEERRRKSFNPKVSIPENAVFSELAVSDGHLVPCAVGQTAYYRFWEYEGKLYFEFYCEPSKTQKAFNNRSVIIDPFCQKDNDSVPVDEAKTLITQVFGEIDANLNITDKALVRFEK